MNNINVVEQINKFIAKHGEGIDKEQMPNIRLHWKVKGAERTVLINENCTSCGTSLSYRPNTHIYYLYMKYDEELDVLAVATATISTSRKPPYIREWEPEGEICYIINKQKMFYNRSGCIKKRMVVGDTRGYYSIDASRYFATVARNWYDKNIKETTRKFLGKTFNTSNIKMEETCFYYMNEWFNKTEKQKKIINNKLQNIINYQLPILEHNSNWFSNDNDWRRTKIVRINTYKGTDVLRIYNSDQEESRLYFTKNKIYGTIYKNEQWEPVDLRGKLASWGTNYRLPYSTEVEKTNILKYFKDIIIKQHDSDNLAKIDIDNLCKLIRKPIIEQLFKGGYKIIGERILLYPSCLKEFGDINVKATNLYKKLGLNKYQLDRTESEFAKRNNYQVNFKVICYIKEMLGVKDISYVDNETFEHIFMFIIMMGYEYIQSNYRMIRRIENKTCFQTLGINEIKDRITICNRLYKIATKNRQFNLQETHTVYHTFKDTVRTYRSLTVYEHITLPEVATNLLHARSESEFQRIHDYVTNISNRINEERRARYDAELRLKREERTKQFQKALPKKQKLFNYEGSEYLIKYSDDPVNQLPKEGSQLHHCVGGYIDSQLSNTTNICFLREKSNPETPFLTIEINDNAVCKHVVQIHGYHNAWMGSSERYIKAIPFVLEWLRIKDIKCPEQILTSKSHGYGYCPQDGFVELPQTSFNIDNILLQKEVI